MTKERYKIIPAVYLLLVEDNKILLMKRYNTGFMDGWYSLPAGHLDGNETSRHGMAREAKEELGIYINPDDLEMKVNMHNIFPTREVTEWFLTTNKYAGEIENKEPHKCSEIKFFPLSSLPENIIPYIRQAIECYKKGVFYSEWGWDDPGNSGFE